MIISVGAERPSDRKDVAGKRRSTTDYFGKASRFQSRRMALSVVSQGMTVKHARDRELEDGLGVGAEVPQHLYTALPARRLS